MGRWIPRVRASVPSSESPNQCSTSSALDRFSIGYGYLGPTEIRLLLIAGNVALMRSPWATIAGHKWLLFDVGGVIAAAGMFAMAVMVSVRHTAELYRLEPLPERQQVEG